MKGYDYSENGAYFITICVKDMREILGKIAGRDDLGAPRVENVQVQLSQCGEIVREKIEEIHLHYENISIDNYIVMPNHIHMIIMVSRGIGISAVQNNDGGALRSSRPTTALIPQIITALKKETNKIVGFSIWQTSYHDRIIRNEKEYYKIWYYIDTNPLKWQDDRYFVES